LQELSVLSDLNLLDVQDTAHIIRLTDSITVGNRLSLFFENGISFATYLQRMKPNAPLSILTFGQNALRAIAVQILTGVT
jgi:hypothetical protein